MSRWDGANVCGQIVANTKGNGYKASLMVVVCLGWRTGTPTKVNSRMTNAMGSGVS